MKKLIPFEETPQTKKIQLQASIETLKNSWWRAEFHLQGDLHKLQWPPASLVAPERRDLLWQNTCFEVFLSSGKSAQDPYFEINAAPQGDWNIYSLQAYRQNLTVFQQGQITVQSEMSPSKDQARVSVTLNASFSSAPHFVGLTAVLQFQDGSLSYWALHHPHSEADFHDKRGFIVSL